ncbi:MAG: hypothetical protein A07HN63_00781 [uncultured archaeon A07HN63]|jgi:hypothetical protein|nr:MAG: hypothetical protein A07HN63_00781 [uncultured archaeon A07HN63]
MLGADPGSENSSVVCIACGESVPRADAREYDKTGDRWERHDKDFEHLCKDCFRDLCHQPREGLESMLIDIEADNLSETEFLDRYLTAVDENPVEEPDS